MSMHKHLFAGIVAMVATAAATTQAATVSMTAGDGFGTSSFNSAGQWNNAAAPSAGNDYFNATFLLRTPSAGNASFTFGGDSLTITGSGLAAGVNNEALMFKGSGVGAVITVDNLTIDGGQLRHGQGDADSFSLAGNLAIGANGANFATQGEMIVSSAISGSSTIRVLDSGNAGTARHITLTSGANTFTGNIELFGQANDRARLILADDANLNFVIGANGVNNSVFGTGTATFDGDFLLDLSGASSNFGDSWTLASAGSQSFGSTFTVPGFAFNGGSVWVNGSYQFNQATGVLSVVPEPATALLAACGVALAIGAVRRPRG
ncbi:MAG: hypothetical protein KDA44_05095 [Planctomycetales bacterium]|nr:hypothetical protein [Planctomycetales bacterium]